MGKLGPGASALVYDGALREQLKKETGCFAGKEQSKWPDVPRAHGIPSLYLLKGDDDLQFVKEW